MSFVRMLVRLSFLFYGKGIKFDLLMIVTGNGSNQRHSFYIFGVKFTTYYHQIYIKCEKDA